MRNKLTTILIISLVLLSIVSIFTGSIKIPITEFSTYSYIIKDIRLPRIIMAICVGAILAECGLIFQCVFRNPMSDSYVLGISSGASCFSSLAILLGLSGATFNISLFAFAGSIITTLLIFVLSKNNKENLLLSGISLNFFLSALTSLFIYFGKRQLDSIIYWTMGSLSGANVKKCILMTIILFILVYIMYRKSSTMDILLLDFSTATSSGINVKRESIVLLIFASIATSFCVSSCGVIGFIGLMAPHFARIIYGPKHSRLILSNAVIGSILLLLSDTLARSVISPSEIPVGIVTAIVGTPVFFTIVRRSR